MPSAPGISILLSVLSMSRASFFPFGVIKTTSAAGFGASNSSCSIRMPELIGERDFLVLVRPRLVGQQHVVMGETARSRASDTRSVQSIGRMVGPPWRCIRIARFIILIWNRLCKHFAEIPTNAAATDFAQLRAVDVIVVQEIAARATSPSLADCNVGSSPNFSIWFRLNCPFLPRKRQCRASASLVRRYRPGARHLRHAHADHRPIVPADLELRLHLAQQFEQARQDRPVPLQLAARREALLAQVPALAVDLPRHHVFGLRVHPLERCLRRSRPPCAEIHRRPACRSRRACGSASTPPATAPCDWRRGRAVRCGRPRCPACR